MTSWHHLIRETLAASFFVALVSSFQSYATIIYTCKARCISKSCDRRHCFHLVLFVLAQRKIVSLWWIMNYEALFWKTSPTIWLFFNVVSGGSKGRPKMLSISCSFLGKFWQNRILAPPFPEGRSPLQCQILDPPLVVKLSVRSVNLGIFFPPNQSKLISLERAFLRTFSHITNYGASVTVIYVNVHTCMLRLSALCSRHRSFISNLVALGLSCTLLRFILRSGVFHNRSLQNPINIAVFPCLLVIL